ncbi:poly(A)+ RNA export protein, putative [Eimeria maxima]|uniref:Poly(A)+ RNA export protein, putative n=1 Tax=Eimeria maxima TaxID=5804 RepID=U6MHB7_EIMMA|nr:poly(A)+ RNA export protein, putative [Eimeria maxima]CDJ61859.1 poly(A)+ RNA export protein, putative [Eimeria maxima]
MAFAFGRSTTESANYYSKQNSTELPNGPSDSVSQLAWSRDGQALACASWDRTCRVWQITTQPAAFGTNGQVLYKGNPQSLFTETAPVLSCCFGDTTQMLLTAGCDKQVKAYDLISGRTTGQVIGQICKAAFHDCFLGICDTFHDCVILNVPLLLQQGQSAFAVNTPSAAAAASIPVITKTGSQFQKMQTRSIGFFTDDATQCPGVVLGSVEGRNLDFSYRCHRQEGPQQQVQIFSVNAVSFNKLKTFSTGGPDQQELAKGHHVYIHAMKEEDIRPRPKNSQRR